MAKKSKKKEAAPPPEAVEPTTWEGAGKSFDCEAPWRVGHPSTADVLRMLANEAKACLYELFRDHVELCYDRQGWPSDAKQWAPIEQERDTLFAAEEKQRTGPGAPGIRYGTTYAGIRYAHDGDGEKGRAKWRLIQLAETTFRTKEEELPWWMLQRWAEGKYWPEVDGLLQHHAYDERLKEELAVAFGGFENFRIGNRRAVVRRLRADEQGREALNLWEQHLAAFHVQVKGRLFQPFGMERDFTYLLHAAKGAFASKLKDNLPEEYRLLELEVYNPWSTYHQPDTLGKKPVDLYNDACTGPERSIVPFKPGRWAKLYLKQVKAIVHRWVNKGQQAEMVRRLEALAEELKAPDPLGHGTPKSRTAVEEATRIIVEGIGKVRAKYAAPVPTTQRQAGAEKPAPTLTERLGAKEGAREALDTMLRTDGLTNNAGEYVGPKRKGKAVVVADWDAVVEHFGLEGYGNADTELSAALCEYVPGLTLDKRVSRVRDDNPYKRAKAEALRFLRSKTSING